VDAVIGRFEKALSAGLEPRVEEFLQCEARDAHPAILHYLLPAEFEHRQPPIDAWEADYIRRLPEYEQDIRAVCRQLRRQSPTAIEPRVPAFPDPEASKAPEQIPILQLRNANEFQNVAYLAKGGYSFVYRADWISDDRQIPVVLKLGIKKHGKPDPASIAEVQKRLNHPNIARFLGVTEDVADNQILIEEFIAGPTLSGFLKETRDQCPIKDVLNWMLKIVAAVEYMHAQGIYHFDLKPANILGFVTGQIEPRIADFGAAVLWENLHIDFTRYFTHAYSAPEQLIAGDRRPGPRCDIFALGVILYQLLTKKLPFGGDDSTQSASSASNSDRKTATAAPRIFWRRCSRWNLRRTNTPRPHFFN
jgi:serine/threonine protein kinase